MPLTRTLQTAVLLALLPLSAGCQTSIDNYFGNRARDLGECFMLQAGLGIGIDVDVKAAGLVHANAGFAAYFLRNSLGWVYGMPRPESIGAPMWTIPSEGEIGLVVRHDSLRYFNGKERKHRCYAILPGVLSWEQGAPLWREPEETMLRQGEQLRSYLDESQMLAREQAERAMLRKARVHAFDIEAGVFILIVGARVGFSPGEFLDFLLGWFGVDIAGDDVGLEEPSDTPTDGVEPQKEAGK